MVKGRRGPLDGNGKPLSWVVAWHKARDLLALHTFADNLSAQAALKKAEDERRRRLLPNDQPLEDLDNSAALVLTGENS